jgi:hypothetical protein
MGTGTLSPGENSRLRPWGKEHTAGEIDCLACGVVNGIRYPHRHREDGTIKHVEFLVYGEAFHGVFVQCCEGGCEMALSVGVEDRQ